MLRTRSWLLSFSVLALSPALATAQSYGDDWAGFEEMPAWLGVAGLSSSSDEVDFAVGDLDRDGDDDLVVVRKQPWTQGGGRENVLLMNEGGVLVDRTGDFASSADLAGDQGFFELTTDRDVQLVDLDRDGWLDVVTCTAALQAVAADTTAHPRVYMNLGWSGGWLGLEYQAARIPVLETLGANPVPTHAVEVAVGDVTGDGYPDLYFIDHDTGFAGYAEPSSQDLEDRLLVNDGTGHFVDATQASMQSVMYVGGFGVGGGIADFNLDGVGDVMRASTGGQSDNVQAVSLAYNDPLDEGDFLIYQEFYNLSPYAVGHGDLNQDGRIDVVVGDDNSDRYLLNEGVDALGRVTWSPPRLFDFITGIENEFTGQVLVHDLDRDGWNDVIIADEDIDIPQTPSARRTHVYHNLGGPVGGEIFLREERKSSSNADWLGAEGLLRVDMIGVYDIAAIDVDGDGWDDLVVGRQAGTTVWRNTTGDRTCQPDLGFQGPGLAQLTACGDELLPGGRTTLVVSRAEVTTPGLLVYGLEPGSLALLGGTLGMVPLGSVPITTDHAGKWVLPELGLNIGPTDVYLQALLVDGSQTAGVGFTNALRLEFL